MKYDVNEMIDLVRTETENLDVSDTIGIKDTEIIKHFNVAQRQLQSKIVGKGSKEFSTVVSLAADPDDTTGRIYLMPINSFMRSKIGSLWTGNNILRKQRYGHNITPNGGCCSNSSCCDYACYQLKPRGYAIIGNRIFLTGPVNKQYDKPTALITEALPNLTQSILEIEPPTDIDRQGGLLDLTATTSFDVNEIKSSRRYCLVDEEGNQVATNIKIDSYDSINNQLILSNSNTEGTITSTENLYLVRGENSSTHTGFEDLARDYIISYAIAKVLQRDGSGEYNVHSADLIGILTEVLDAYTNVSDDVMTIPYFPEDY